MTKQAKRHCRGCGSWCAIPGCAVCAGYELCQKCQRDGLRCRSVPLAEITAHPRKSLSPRDYLDPLPCEGGHD